MLDDGVARRLCVLFSLPVGVRITRSGIAKVYSAAAPRVAKTVVGEEGSCEGVLNPKSGAPKGSARSRSDGRWGSRYARHGS